MTLLPAGEKVGSWYLGANIPGKPRSPSVLLRWSRRLRTRAGRGGRRRFRGVRSCQAPAALPAQRRLRGRPDDLRGLPGAAPSTLPRPALACRATRSGSCRPSCGEGECLRVDLRRRTPIAHAVDQFAAGLLAAGVSPRRPDRHRRAELCRMGRHVVRRGQDRGGPGDAERGVPGARVRLHAQPVGDDDAGVCRAAPRLRLRLVPRGSPSTGCRRCATSSPSADGRSRAASVGGPPVPEDARRRPIRTPVCVAARRPRSLLYTSGTTGDPKGAVLTHAGILASATRAGRPPRPDVPTTSRSGTCR